MLAVFFKENLTFFGDRMSKQNRKPDPDMVLDDVTLASTAWLDKSQVEKLFGEEIRKTQVYFACYPKICGSPNQEIYYFLDLLATVARKVSSIN